MSNIITGLDIGSHTTKCVVGEKEKDGTLKILGAFRESSSGMRRGVMVDPEEALPRLKEIARELGNIGKEARENVYVNIASEHMKIRISRGIAAVGQPDKEIKQEDVDRAIQASRASKILPNHRVLHTIIREFTVDDIGDIQSPVGMTGSRIEISTLLVECFAPHLEVLMDTLKEAKMTIGGVVFDPLAGARAVLGKRQKELGVIFVDFGSGTVSVSAFEEQKPLYAGTFPVGVGYITNDIAAGLKIPVEEAEKIKKEFGSAFSKKVSRKDTVRCSSGGEREGVSRRFLSEIIELRVADIIEMIEGGLKTLRNRFQFPAGVVAVGGGMRLPGMVEALREGMRLPVQIGFPDLTLFDIPNPAYENMVHDPEFATAVGLMLIGNDELAARQKNIFRSVKKAVQNLIP